MKAKKSNSFRGWFYFRMGWSTYFAFISAAINTITVTYFLAIDNYPLLKTIFPTFLHYIVIIGAIGIPILIGIGYAHFKRSPAYSSEASVLYETNPFARRQLVNSELIVQMNIALIPIFKKLSSDEKLTEEEVAKFERTLNDISEFLNEREEDRKKELKYVDKIRES
tara:strand:- start:290 stop:790 length:501 start_codon:yes stop_codon:yes gene_type:complete